MNGAHVDLWPDDRLMARTDVGEEPITTRLLDGFVAAVMVTIAVLLLTGGLGGAA